MGVRWAFERTLGAIDRKALQQEADARRDFFGNGQVAVELWFYSARDDAKGCWDFAAAERRSRQGLADLGIGKDPAEARVQTDAVAGGRVLDQLLHYSTLRRTMGESEYTDLVRGCSAADTVFCDARPGELQGPLRGVRGWWLARLCRRNHAEAFEVNDERCEHVHEVYLQRRFLEWAAAVLAKAVLRVPAK